MLGGDVVAREQRKVGGIDVRVEILLGRLAVAVAVAGVVVAVRDDKG